MNAEEFPLITVGTVVDTNDPQQNGRLRVNCPRWGDTPDTKVTDMAWAAYVSPFGGILTRGYRGPENVTTGGPVAYGMWAIPKVGSLVLCMLVDGDPNHRVWIGCLQADHMMHTLPMGRYLDGGETGPVSSTEQPIEPLASNMDEAFGTASGNYERLTRGTEGQAASISNTIIDKVVSAKADYRQSIFDRTGYQHTRIRPDIGFAETEGGNFDPQTYSLTTPGLHSFVMDDSLKNGKIRIRSTSGNQVILDDTNERIYISTAEGKSWVELDQAGNIDVYSDRRISMHALKGFNFTTEGEFRVSAGSIHLRTQTGTRIEADTTIDIRSGTTLNANVGSTMSLSVASNLDIQTGGYFNTTSGGAYNVTSGLTLRLTSSGVMDFQAGGNLNQDAPEIHLNDGLSSAATGASTTAATHAYTTSRVPIHEPWGRISNNSALTDQDVSTNAIASVLNMTNTSGTLELSYTSADANKVDLGDNLGRNDNWRR